MHDKAQLRRQLLAQRQQNLPEVRSDWDRRIGAQIFAWWQKERPACLGVYWPVRGEPDLKDLYGQLCQCGAQLALPVVIARGEALRFARWIPGAETDRDMLGMTIPAAPLEFVQPTAVLVPCVGFTVQRLRLGYGGGFYDRTLSVSPRPDSLGVAYSNALCAFEGDAFDIALDRIITE